jgi:hypothetical protein
MLHRSAKVRPAGDELLTQGLGKNGVSIETGVFSDSHIYHFYRSEL